MDWVITDADDAIEGAKSGEYYAAIVLPPTLSDDMFTFYAGNSEPSRIDLYVNEKKNPISPLLVSSGAQGVSAQISASFTRALSEVSFGLIETASDFFNEAETQQALDSIEKRTASARDQLLSIADTVDALASLTESSVPLVDSAERISAALGDSLDQVRPADLGPPGGPQRRRRGARGGAGGDFRKLQHRERPGRPAAGGLFLLRPGYGGEPDGHRRAHRRPDKSVHGPARHH